MTRDASRAALLRELTRRHQDLVVWKHLDRALLGQGDIDAAASISEADAIVADVVRMAPTILGATHVIPCNHVENKLLHFFVQPHLLPQLFEFDLCTQPARGLAPWANPAGMLPLAVVGPEGIRRLRPGAEAVVSLVYHGLSPRGTYRLTGDEWEIVVRGLAEDLPGAQQACSALPPRPARIPLRELVECLSNGIWTEKHARRAFFGFVASGLAHPSFTVRRVLFRTRLTVGRECLMSRLARKHGRQVPETGLDQLLRDARETGHDVVTLSVPEAHASVSARSEDVF